MKMNNLQEATGENPVGSTEREEIHPMNEEGFLEEITSEMTDLRTNQDEILVG